MSSRENPYKITTHNTEKDTFRDWLENRTSLDEPLKSSDENDLVVVYKVYKAIHE